MINVNSLYCVQYIVGYIGQSNILSCVQITVRIVNGSLDRPVFPQDIYYKEVPSTSDLNVTLLQVSAGQGPLIYTIIGKITSYWS